MKQKKYLIIGGLITLSLSTFCYYLIEWFGYIDSIKEEIVFKILLLLFWKIPAIVLWVLLSFIPFPIIAFVENILIIFISLLIGMLLGWLCGKIINRNVVNI